MNSTKAIWKRAEIKSLYNLKARVIGIKCDMRKYENQGNLNSCSVLFP